MYWFLYIDKFTTVPDKTIKHRHLGSLYALRILSTVETLRKCWPYLKAFGHNFLSSLAAAFQMTKVNANTYVFSKCGWQTYYSCAEVNHMKTYTPLLWCPLTGHDKRGREALFDHLILNLKSMMRKSILKAQVE